LICPFLFSQNTADKKREIIDVLFTVPMNKSLCKNILALDNSIGFAALSNNLGAIEAAEYRTGLKPLD
jgi:hypothetical protein